MLPIAIYHHWKRQNIGNFMSFTQHRTANFPFFVLFFRSLDDKNCESSLMEKQRDVSKQMEPPTVLVRNKSTTSTALPAVLLCYFCTQSIKFIFAVTTENSKYMQDVSCERKIIKEQKKAKRVKIHSAGNKFKKWRAITSKIN